MKYLMIMLLSPALLAQADIDSILDRNPFDPERGRKEEVVEAAAVEETDELPANTPILDGTLIIGDTKIALLSYVQEGKQITARAKLNERVAGYTISSIERNSVVLKGPGEPINLALYNGQKKTRGGSKKAAAKPKRGSSRPAPKRPEPKAEKKKDDPKKFKRRNLPKRPPSERAKKLGEKF